MCIFTSIFSTGQFQIKRNCFYVNVNFGNQSESTHNKSENKKDIYGFGERWISLLVPKHNYVSNKLKENTTKYRLQGFFNYPLEWKTYLVCVDAHVFG